MRKKRILHIKWHLQQTKSAVHYLAVWLAYAHGQLFHCGTTHELNQEQHMRQRRKKIEKKNTHNSIRNTRRWNRGKQNIEIKPINLNFSNECSAELRALSSKLVRCFHAVYLFSFGSLHRCYWLIYFMLFTLTAVSSYWNSFTWPIECNARMCILVLSNWNFHGNPDKQS